MEQAGLVVERVPLNLLTPDPANVRLHDERNLDAIKGSLARFGQQKPIVVDRKGVIRAGNGTFAAAKALGWKHLDVVRTDLEATEAAAFSIADNRTSDLSAFDDAALAKLLEQLREEDALAGVGFDDADVDALLDQIQAGLETDVVEDEVPALPDAATTRLGDLWVLGRHRLLVGDSASEEDLDRLLAGAPIHLVNTDPPYNVKVEPRSNNAIAAGLSSFSGPKPKAGAKLRAKDRPLANDFVSDEEFARLLRAWFKNAARVLEPGRAFYVWGGYSNLANYPPALAEAGLYFSQAIVWNKLHPVLTRKDFMGCFEIAYYGWREGAAHVYLGPNNALDLWEVQKVTPTKMCHLTEKPVELAARAIGYSSRPGENVLDLFGGSGSTMAACEQTGRNAYLVELDPLYADVIVQRWERLSGGQATLDGKTYAEVAAEREVAA